MSSDFESPVAESAEKAARAEQNLQRKAARDAKKAQFLDEMAKRHAGARIGYEEFRSAAKPVFGYWEDAPYRVLWGSFRRLRLFEELAALYPTSPCTFGEFKAASVAEEWAESTIRQSYMLFKKRMSEQWKDASEGNQKFTKVQPPYADLLQVLADVTGFSCSEVVHCLLAHYASQILGQRVDLVESFVTASTMPVEEIALVKKLLGNMNISDDPRILGLDSQRLAKRRRRHAIGSVFGG